MLLGFFAFSALMGVLASLWLIFMYSRVPDLRDVPVEEIEWPSVSVLVAARNEEATLGPALETLRRLDYPELEIVFVNDRSTDATGDILEAERRHNTRLKVVHIDELPPRWLGKTHALHQAAAAARGELFLFTDADVRFDPSTLKKAVTLMRNKAVDHLVCGPRLLQRSFFDKIWISHFAAAFGLRFQPGFVELPSTWPYVGIGAFNLVSATAYRACGGHEPLRLTVVDDAEMGRLLKSNGFRQAFAGAVDELAVEWNLGLRGVLAGLEKNMYAGYLYSPWLALMGILSSIVYAATPLALALLGAPELGLLCWLTLAGAASIYAPKLGAKRWAGLFYPLGALAVAAASLRSMLVSEMQGGIRWRDTFYPLSLLREGDIYIHS